MVPDGNRRWARARGLSVREGHAAGIRNVGRLARVAWEEGVEVFTFWWGSPANLTHRDPGEVADIVDVLAGWLAGPARDLLAGRRLVVAGRWEALCPALGPALRRAQAAAGAGPQTLVLLMAYDGRDEIRDAAARVGAGADADAFTRALWTGTLPPVDLVLRTGGEPHLSAGFLLWQIAEARLAFTPTLWPALAPAAFRRHLARARATPRRYGR